MEARKLTLKINRSWRNTKLALGVMSIALTIIISTGCSTASGPTSENQNNQTCRAEDVVKPGWERSFKAGTRDSENHYMGGSTIVHLLGHKGKLFAGNSYWHDSRNIWYGGTDPSIGWAQVLRLDKPGGKWQVDLELGRQHLRVEILKSVTFTTDDQGNPLSKPVNLLVASTYTPTPSSVEISVFTRNDETGSWERSIIYSGKKPADLEDRSVRAIKIHKDTVTGVDRIFLSIGKLGIYSGVYDATAPGKIRWNDTSESGPVETRVLAIIEANGSLLFSAGRMVYRRNDGASPSYTLVHDMSDLHAGVSRQPVGGIRGMTSIPNPNGEGESLLFVMGEGNRSRGCVYRLDPDGNGRYTRHKEICIDTLMTNFLNGNPVYFILAAYNDIYPVVDPTSGELLYLIGFESWIGGHQYPLWGANDKGGLYAGGMYAIRDKNGNYRVNEVNGASTLCTPPLVATTVMTLSPFEENKGEALYFAGHDGNHKPSDEMAWIFSTSLKNALRTDAPRGKRLDADSRQEMTRKMKEQFGPYQFEHRKEPFFTIDIPGEFKQVPRQGANVFNARAGGSSMSISVGKLGADADLRQAAEGYRSSLERVGSGKADLIEQKQIRLDDGTPAAEFLIKWITKDNVKLTTQGMTVFFNGYSVAIGTHTWQGELPSRKIHRSIKFQ